MAPAVFLTCLFIVLSAQSYPLSASVTLQMILVLHALYYWTIFRPALFPVWAAFLAGFAIDLVGGSLLGLNAFLLVLTQIVIGRQRRYLLSQPFATQWAGFLVVSLAYEGARWAVMGLVTWTIFSPVSAMASAVCSGALYALSSFLMTGCLRLVAGPGRSDILQD